MPLQNHKIKLHAVHSAGPPVQRKITNIRYVLGNTSIVLEQIDVFDKQWADKLDKAASSPQCDLPSH